MNEEELAQSSQEGPAQEAPPPYSSIAAANAGTGNPQLHHILSDEITQNKQKYLNP